MLTALAHFAAGTAGSVLIFLISVRFSGERSFSAPFGLVFIGVFCAVLSTYISAWATPVVLSLYALTRINEALQSRKDRRDLSSRP